LTTWIGYHVKIAALGSNLYVTLSGCYVIALFLAQTGFGNRIVFRVFH